MDANDVLLDIDSNFEPLSRIRSNTWPCHPAEICIDGQNGSPVYDDAVNDQQKDTSSIKQKSSSRRNAWGNLSYADLITKAIQSSHEQRLTLSQIYDWMVQNVPYFKDKGDNTSSAGWKNSIRHNLSLHNRFMRIQNESTGKSSWWVINPDAKPGKAPRRRAGSMETKNLEKKRGRVKKRVEAIRTGQDDSVSNEEYQEMHYNNFSLSPEFRTQAGSNASSGHLSPIEAAVEPDLHDIQVPPMSPIPWGTELDDNYETRNRNFSLVDSLIDGLNLHEAGTRCHSSGSNDVEMASVGNSTIKQELLSDDSFQYNTQNSYETFGDVLVPPSYNDRIEQQQQCLQQPSRNYSNMSPNSMFQDNVQQQQHHQRSVSNNGTTTLGVNTQLTPVRSPQVSPSHNYIISPQPRKLSPQNIANQAQLNHLPMNLEQQHIRNNGTGGRSLLQQCLEAPDDIMLRVALAQHMPAAYQIPQVRAAQPGEFDQCNFLNSMTLNNEIRQSVRVQQGQHQPMMQDGQIAATESGSSLAEIDTNSMVDLDYDIEQLLRHELEMDSNLDFNFDSSANVVTSDSKQIVR